MTWREFDRKSNRFCNLLLSRGIKPGTKVSLLLMNCLEWLPIYFGILKAGCIVVPLNYRYTAEEIKYCVNLSDSEILIFGEEFIDRVESVKDDFDQVKTLFYVGKNTPDFAENGLNLSYYCSVSPSPVKLKEDEIAAIYYSSGTTGFPKAILHDHKALVESCRTEQDNHQTTADDVFLCIPPLYHTGAKMH